MKKTSMGDEEHDEHEDEHAEAEEAGFEEDFVTANITTKFEVSDFVHYRFGASLADGDNGLGDSTTVGGIHFALRLGRKRI